MKTNDKSIIMNESEFYLYLPVYYCIKVWIEVKARKQYIYTIVYEYKQWTELKLDINDTNKHGLIVK